TIERKDFLLNPDEQQLRTSARNMVAYLSSGLVLITARSALQEQIQSYIKSHFCTVLGISQTSTINNNNNNNNNTNNNKYFDKIEKQLSNPATQVTPIPTPITPSTQSTSSTTPTTTTITSTIATISEPQYRLSDFKPSTFQSLSSMLKINSNLALFRVHLNLKTHIYSPIEQAINESFQTVQRSLKVATTAA
ncbi:unnamed protein product, partial [Rotaria sp. Silwood2]